MQNRFIQMLQSVVTEWSVRLFPMHRSKSVMEVSIYRSPSLPERTPQEDALPAQALRHKEYSYKE
ncbi:MAG: hypothetical protein AAFZ80_01765 [Cyanobacteria bacterium P01_A01_bin.105]